VKVLDFGLAKAAVPDVDVANSPTFTVAATQMGMIVGTAAYMAPEQARGKPIDKRADIWAFGCVLYEMLTGHQAFASDTVTDIVAAVLKSDPDWTTLPADTPLRLRDLLGRCLDKEPRKRLRDIGDARLELDAISAVGHVTDPILRPGARLPPSSSWSPRVPWIAAAAAAIAALAVAAVHLSEKPADSAAINLALLPPAGAVFHEIELSPDGRKIAFTAQDGTGRTQLWIRSLDSPTPRALNATQGASYPFWSPDSRSVAFFAQGKLKKVPDSGGPPQVLAEAPVGRGGTWNRDGVIVFAPRLDDVLYRVADVGGETIPVTRLDPALGHYSHRLPRFLPDGRRFLYLAQSAQREHLGVYVGSIRKEDGPIGTRLLGDQSGAVYAANPAGTGYLLFIRDHNLMAHEFDPATLRVSGQPLTLAASVGISRPALLASPGMAETGGFSVSANGTLVYQPAGGLSDRLTWFDRTGRVLGAFGGRGLQPCLSPDGMKVIVEQFDAATATPDLWLFDLRSGRRTRVTFDPAIDTEPVCSPDGSRFVFASNRRGAFNLYQKAADGSGHEEPLVESNDSKWATDWSLDGQYIAYSESTLETGSDVWILPLFGDRKPVPFVRGRWNEFDGAFSPDHRWIAYVSDESGREEVYVQPFPATGAKWQISANGGTKPRWSRNRKEIFYLAPDSKLMAVDVQSNGHFETRASRELFQTGLTILGSARYAVTADGQRFLMSAPPAGEALSLPATVVVNWTAGLK
jgi:Tol biopolymer transport system component